MGPIVTDDSEECILFAVEHEDARVVHRCIQRAPMEDQKLRKCREEKLLFAPPLIAFVTEALLDGDRDARLLNRVEDAHIFRRRHIDFI